MAIWKVSFRRGAVCKLIFEDYRVQTPVQYFDSNYVSIFDLLCA
jgi:hypothetical protein